MTLYLSSHKLWILTELIIMISLSHDLVTLSHDYYFTCIEGNCQIRVVKQKNIFTLKCFHNSTSVTPGADPGEGGPGGQDPPPPFGAPPFFIKREKTLRVCAQKRRILVLNSYSDSSLSEILYLPLQCHHVLPNYVRGLFKQKHGTTISSRQGIGSYTLILY